MRTISAVFIATLVSSPVIGQVATYSNVNLTFPHDQIRFVVPNEPRYFFMSKTTGTEDKAFAFHSPDDNANGTWFFSIQEGTGNFRLHKGNLGIGTLTPYEQLQIGDRWTFHDGGHKIIGYNFKYEAGEKRIVNDEASAIRLTNDGRIRFDVAPSGVAGSSIEFTSALLIQNNGNVSWGVAGALKRDQGASIELGGSGNPYLDFTNDTSTDFDARLILRGDDRLELSGANLLIGKSSQTNTTYKVDVDGKIRANEIVVNTDGADYVLDPEYKLRSLSDLEKFIQENRHLPGIPTAAEMQSEGMAVAETTTKLLEKIEELTLYLIELEKRVDHLELENNELRRKVGAK